jgi:hypothetical protein
VQARLNAAGAGDFFDSMKFIKSRTSYSLLRPILYQALDIVPGDMRDDLGRAKVVITNYHALRRREKLKASKLTKDLLGKAGEQSPAL